MSDIPTDVYRKILLRLPADTLFRLKSVCKSWLGIIEDPSFLKAHASNQVYSHTLLIRNETGAPLYSFCLDSLNFIKGPQMIDAAPIKWLIPALQQDNFYIASCNGLILISHALLNKRWTIWNPLTGESHRLPRPSAFGLNIFVFGFGFGYDGVTDDYKVMRIYGLFYLRKTVYRTLVYSLKSKSWSTVEGCPCKPLDRRGAFWNGALYWRSRDCIIAIDLGTERYCQLPLPPTTYDSYGARLEALDGCLICTLDNCTEETFDGWVMKDNVWIKLFSLQNSFVDEPLELKLVAYLKRKGQVVLQYSEGFLWFDIGNNSVLKFSIHDLPHIESSVICPGSLVRLNVHGDGSGLGAVTSGTTLTRKRKRKRNTAITDTSLKFCVRDVEDECCSDSEDSCRCCKAADI